MRTALVDFHRLQIRQPAAFRFVHRVADVIARHRTFAANIAAFRHRILLFERQGGGQPEEHTTLTVRVQMFTQ